MRQAREGDGWSRREASRAYYECRDLEDGAPTGAVFGTDRTALQSRHPLSSAEIVPVPRDRLTTSQGLLEAPQQRLRLRDLWHFRGRQEAFERRGENGLRIFPAAGRLAKLGKRVRGHERIAAGALRVSDRDGGLKPFLGQTGFAGRPHQQDIAAQPVKIGVGVIRTGRFGYRLSR